MVQQVSNLFVVTFFPLMMLVDVETLLTEDIPPGPPKNPPDDELNICNQNNKTFLSFKVLNVLVK
jgi:hypothetical protein